MLNKEEFMKRMQEEETDIFANIGDYVMSKLSIDSDEDTRRVFPVALFRHAAGLLYWSLTPDDMQSEEGRSQFIGRIAHEAARMAEMQARERKVSHV